MLLKHQWNVQNLFMYIFLYLYLHILMHYSVPRHFFIFLEKDRGREGEREKEKHQCEREALISCLSYTPSSGTEPATQAGALTGNWTRDLSLCRVTSNPLSHISQGNTCTLIKFIEYLITVCQVLFSWKRVPYFTKYFERERERRSPKRWGFFCHRKTHSVINNGIIKHCHLCKIQ